MQITGTVKTILPIESGVSKADKPWSKQTFVIEFKDGSYDKQLALSVMKPELIANIAIGQTVMCEINASSREYNGKYYTDVSAWKVTVGGQASPVPAPLNEQASDLPF